MGDPSSTTTASGPSDKLKAWARRQKDRTIADALGKRVHRLLWKPRHGDYKTAVARNKQLRALFASLSSEQASQLAKRLRKGDLAPDFQFTLATATRKSLLAQLDAVPMFAGFTDALADPGGALADALLGGATVHDRGTADRGTTTTGTKARKRASRTTTPDNRNTGPIDPLLAAAVAGGTAIVLQGLHGSSPASTVERGQAILEIFSGRQGASSTGVQEDAKAGPRMRSAKTPPGARPQPVHFDVGNFSHDYAELLIGADELPRNLDAEREIVLGDGSKKRLDRVDWKNRTIYEVKPDTPAEIKRGKQQLRIYKHYMDEAFPSKGPWKTKLVTYSKAKAVQVMKDIGWLAPDAPATATKKGATKKGATKKGARTKGGPSLKATAFSIAGGLLYDEVSKRAIAKRSKDEGYVPFGPGAYADETRIEQFGRFMLDPTFGADVGMDKRFDIAAWRKKLRDKANKKELYETLEVTWQLPGKFDIYSNRGTIKDVEITYKKLRKGWVHWSGKWPKDAPIPKPPDLNRVISEQYSDEQVRELLGIPKPPIVDDKGRILS